MYSASLNALPFHAQRAGEHPVLGVGELSPLRKAIGFARSCDVAAMRDLLLEYGATEGKADRLRWRQRQYSDANDIAWLRKFHEDDREG